MSQIVELLARLTRRWLIVELVDSSDPMFRILLRGRDSRSSEWSIDQQERVLGSRFRFVDKVHLPEMARTVYLAEKA